MDGITDRAGKQLRKRLDAEGAGENQCLRYVSGNDGIEMTLSGVEPTDQVFEYEGRKVFAVDAVSFVSLAGQKLDYRENRFQFV